MKKLLVILLLFFPVHGAWGEDKIEFDPPIEGILGFKFGMSIDEVPKKNIIKFKNIESVEVKPIKEESPISGSVSVNKFDNVFLRFNPETKKLFEISGLNIFNSDERLVCIFESNKISSIIADDYPFLKWHKDSWDNQGYSYFSSIRFTIGSKCYPREDNKHYVITSIIDHKYD